MTCNQNKDAEIERLKNQHEEMLLKHAKEQGIALEALEKVFQEIERLKGQLANEQENNRKLRLLLRRAADALALELVSRHSRVETQDYSYLIAELREAAK